MKLCSDVVDETGLCDKYLEDIDNLVALHSTKQIEINVLFVFKKLL